MQLVPVGAGLLYRWLGVILDATPDLFRTLYARESSDEVQRHVYACGHPSRSDHITVVDKAGIRTKLHRGLQLL